MTWKRQSLKLCDFASGVSIAIDMNIYIYIWYDWNDYRILLVEVHQHVATVSRYVHNKTDFPCKSCIDDSYFAADLGKHLSRSEDWTRQEPVIPI